MMKTIALMLIALSFAGDLRAHRHGPGTGGKGPFSGYTREKGLVIATVLTAWAILLGTGQQYVAIIMTGRLFRPEYEARDLQPCYLSRSSGGLRHGVSAALSPTAPAPGLPKAPWGVSAWQYGPFTFFGWINPLIAIALAAWKGPKKEWGAQGASLTHQTKAKEGAPCPDFLSPPVFPGKKPPSPERTAAILPAPCG